MRPSQILRSGGGEVPGKYGHYLGTWGNLGSQPQKNIITYGLSSNRQNAFAGAAHDAIFNTARRTSAQIFYWVPPFLLAYYAINWATERNHFLNSKKGREEFGAP